MIRIERTTDYELIRSVMTSPAVYPHITDDYSPAAEEYCPPVHDLLVYVAVWEDEELLGLWLFVPQNGICWEVHTCLLPCARGHRARRAAKHVMAWIWRNTPCRRIVTNVPETNRLAYHFALNVGMEFYGCNEKSFLKDGKLVDQMCLGMSRPRAIPIPEALEPQDELSTVEEG